MLGKCIRKTGANGIYQPENLTITLDLQWIKKFLSMVFEKAFLNFYKYFLEYFLELKFLKI